MEEPELAARQGRPCRCRRCHRCAHLQSDSFFFVASSSLVRHKVLPMGLIFSPCLRLLYDMKMGLFVFCSSGRDSFFKLTAAEIVLVVKILRSFVWAVKEKQVEIRDKVCMRTFYCNKHVFFFFLTCVCVFFSCEVQQDGWKSKSIFTPFLLCFDLWMLCTLSRRGRTSLQMCLYDQLMCDVRQHCRGCLLLFSPAGKYSSSLCTSKLRRRSAGCANMRSSLSS